jgi:DNA-binding Xre family transcriptional regulator
VLENNYIAHSTQEVEMSMIRLKVKDVAQAKGIGQGKLQRIADMDIKTVRRIYRDPYTIITTETLWKLAKALDVDPRELIEGEPDEPLETH